MQCFTIFNETDQWWNKSKWTKAAYQRGPPPPDHLPGSPLLRSDAAGCCLSSSCGGTAESSRTSQKIHIQGTEEEEKAAGHFGEVQYLSGMWIQLETEVCLHVFYIVFVQRLKSLHKNKEQSREVNHWCHQLFLWQHSKTSNLNKLHF